jgi:hypothetical protein
MGCTPKIETKAYPVFLDPSIDITDRSNDNFETSDIALSKQMDLLWTENNSFKVSLFDSKLDAQSRKVGIVNNCTSMIELYSAGYEPQASYGVYRSLYIQCKLIDVAKSLRSSDTSYLSNFKLDFDSIKNLPKNMAFIVATSQYNRILNDPKIKTLDDASKIIEVSEDEHGQVFAEDDSDGLQYMSILAKGDVNNDNIEDIVIKVVNAVKQGSYTASHLYVLTKTKNEGDWIVLVGE